MDVSMDMDYKKDCREFVASINKRIETNEGKSKEALDSLYKEVTKKHRFYLHDHDLELDVLDYVDTEMTELRFMIKSLWEKQARLTLLFYLI